MRNLYELPPNLPMPLDDGATKHLLNLELPKIKLQSTIGAIDLAEAFQNPSVLFIYPKAGSPLESNANLELWDSIPGARGCTPHSCGFRDLYQQFLELGVSIYGLSIQSPFVQQEFVERNNIKFPVLSDADYKLTNALKLPTFDFEGESLIKRMALFIEAGIIKKVFYPVFPPDKNALEVLNWLRSMRL